MRIRRFVRRLLGRDRWVPLVARPDAKAALHLKYLTFKDLIASNDEILEVIADMERKLEGRTPFGMAFVRTRCVTAASHAYRMIQSLNTLSGRRYPELFLRFPDIQRAVEAALDRGRTSSRGPLVLPLTAVDLSSLEKVGGKSANLGELKNRAGLPVPEGFAVTTDGCLEFFESNQLGEEIRARLLGFDAEDLASATEASEAVRQAILEAPLPARLGAAILEGYDRLGASLGGPPRVAVRSSAVGEDGELSFAGQYISVLNVGREQVLPAYKEVVAGLYTPRALCYRALRGIPEEDTPMGVACLAMVDAAASGVACSEDPGRPTGRTVVINGAWGLGSGTVEGAVSPDSWTVSKERDGAVLTRSRGAKESRVEPLPEGGVAALSLPGGLPDFCLRDDQVRELARLVAAVERHYGAPQEVEWALDRSGRLVLLQSRPLRRNPQELDREKPPAEVDGHRLLAEGVPACSGCASGPAFLSFAPDDIGECPEGAVLVARHSAPQYVRVMGRACAIVADVGAPTGHMASLAREFGIPAVLETRDATARLAPGAVVTVDGGRGGVYEGRVEGLLAARPEREERTMIGTPIYAVLEEVSRHVVTLNLTDPRAPDFRAHACRTFHDLARFAHEKAFEEMFRISDRASSSELRSLPLEAHLPFTVYLIDLGGGLRVNPGSRKVASEEVTSVPMRALLAGMTHPELRWWTPRTLSLRGFAAVTTEALFSPVAETTERRLGDRSYAIVADAYCNFSSRIGYHYAAVDAYCTQTAARNYISFRFKGGAADEARRINRCVLIDRILRRMDFQVERQGDLVNARLRKYGPETLLACMDQLGRMIVATRQLDMRLHPSSSIDWYVEAFFEGNYLFEPGFRVSAATEGAP